MNRLRIFENFDYVKLDFLLISLFLTISLCGLIILSSASVYFSDSVHGSPMAIFNRQLIYFFIGLIGLIVTFVTPVNLWPSYDRLFLSMGFYNQSLTPFSTQIYYIYDALTLGK